MTEQSQSSLQSLVSLLRRLAGLHLENARLTVAEKLTLLFAAVAAYSVAMILGMVALVFVTMGIATLLAEYIAPYWIYLIVGGVFVAIIVCLFVFRKALLIDPIARFVSRLIVAPPKSFTEPTDNGKRD